VDRLDRQRCQKLPHLAGRHHHEAVGLVVVARDLGGAHRRGDPDARRDADVATNPVFDVPGEPLWDVPGGPVRDVQIRLVDAHDTQTVGTLL